MSWETTCLERPQNLIFIQVSLYKCTIVCSKLVDHSDVVGASPVGPAPTTSFILDLTPGVNGLGKDNWKTRRESLKFWDLVWLILEILLFSSFYRMIPSPQDHNLNLRKPIRTEAVVSTLFDLDILYASQLLISLANCLFSQQLFRLPLKKAYLRIAGTLFGESISASVDSPHKGPVMRKAFPCHDIIKLWVVLWIVPSAHVGLKCIVLVSTHVHRCLCPLMF